MAIATSTPILTPEQEASYQAEIDREKRRSFLDRMAEEGDRLSDYRPTEEKFNRLTGKIQQKSWGSYTKEEQEQLCSWQSGVFGLSRLPGKKTRYRPRYCGHCPKCLKKQAEEREEKFRKARLEAQIAEPEGKWKKKTVTKKEADSLKKQISRKHGKRHMQVPNTEDDEMVDVWSYSADDDPKLGKEANPNEIDWDAVNRKCKNGGGSVSFGGGMRPKSDPPQEDTQRFLVPEVVVNRKDLTRAIEIMNDVNLLEEAETIEEVQDLSIRQFIMAVEALQAQNLEIVCIADRYLNLPIEQTIKDWNEFVRKCLYGSEGNTNIIGANTDKIEESGLEKAWRELVYPGTSL